ncbi:MAG: histidinol-phosphate transaminase [Termitinemataceae bacterium]|nr:MAG: histidinol-phosphate transaminase [Termitinemataceae bacterium]
MTTSKYWNKRICGLSPYIAGEQPKTCGIIKLNTNENPYPPSPQVLQAIKNADTNRLRLYPDPACTKLRNAVAQKYNVGIENVFAGNGSDEVLAFSFGAFFESFDFCPQRADDNVAPILFPDITYSFYPVYAKLFNIPYKKIPLNDQFCIDTNHYNISCGGIIFPNPNAPTGIALTAKEIVDLAKNKKDNVVIVDEAYNGFGGESVVPYLQDNPNLLVVQTMSKNASLAGMRVGYAIGSAELIEALCRIRDSFNSYTVDMIAQEAATAAIMSSTYYNEINAKIICTRERLYAEIKALAWTVLPSKSNFLFMKPEPQSHFSSRCRNSDGHIYADKIPAVKLFNKLKENNIFVRHFNNERINDYLRVSIGTDEQIDKFLEVCKKAQSL